MQLVKHVQDLLYRYDCVIIPEFGGFITKRISARIENKTSFYPPYKQLGFNANLQHNDGLLANELVAVYQINFEEASTQIRSQVQEWNRQLQTEELIIEGIGKFFKNQQLQLVFEPLNEVNYLTSSFGLSQYSSALIQKDEHSEVATQSRARGIPVFVKYAATAAIVLTLGALGWKGYEQQQNRKEYAKQQELIEKKIQSATFVIDNPLPTVNLNVKKAAPKRFHVVAGSFQFEENALKKVKQLEKKGFNAYILGKNKWGLTQVAYDSYADRYEAYRNLAAIRKSDSKDAWLLIKTLQ